MKKILLSVCFFLGLLALSSCTEEKVNITYRDSSGNDKTIVVEATEDEEIIQGVLDYANQATYENIEEVSFQGEMKLSAVFDESMTSLFPTLGGNGIDATATASLNLKVKEGMNLSIAANANLGNQNSAEFNLNAYYDNALDSLTTEDANLYCDLSYGLNSSTGENMSFSQKKLISLEDVWDAIQDETDFPEYIPEPDEIAESFSLADFKSSFPTSKIVISEVQKGVIQIHLFVTIFDIVNLVKEEAGTSSELNEILQKIKTIYNYTDLTKGIELAFGIEAKTGRTCGFSVKLEDPQILNLILIFVQDEGSFLADSMQMAAIADAATTTFSFSLEYVISYENVEVKKLSSSEKAQYKVK